MWEIIVDSIPWGQKIIDLFKKDYRSKGFWKELVEIVFDIIPWGLAIWRKIKGN